MFFSKTEMIKMCCLLFILFVMFSIGSSNAKANAHLTIVNNTGATIEVTNSYINYGYSTITQPILVSPVDVIKLQDFLSMGRNEIRITSPCSRTPKDVVRPIWVSGSGSKSHKIEVTESDFGAFLMADRPGCPESKSKPIKVPSRTLDPTGGTWITEHIHNKCDANVGNKSICKKYQVKITFEHRNGELVGKPSLGDTIHGQLNGLTYNYKYGWGWGTLTFTPDFKHFSGYFRDKYGHGGDWNGDRP